MKRRDIGSLAVILTISASAAIGCNGKPAMTELAEARRISADLHIEFSKAADRSSRAVMSTDDESSRAFAREAEASKASVQKDIEGLKPLLLNLGYPEESASLEEFAARFAEYKTLDDRILDLAVENSNLKAQQISFGPAQAAADAFQDALDSLSEALKNDWDQALSATAVAAVRHIQALQAPHIAEADDAAMTRNEGEMAKSEAAARPALHTLASLVPPASRPRLEKATAAFDGFMNLNAQVVALSRRNTNVRSLALSLNEKGKLGGACEESLRKLADALAGRVVGGSR